MREELEINQDRSLPTPERLLSPRSVALLLDFKPRTITNMIARGQLRGVMISGCWRIPQSELDRLARGSAA